MENKIEKITLYKINKERLAQTLKIKGKTLSSGAKVVLFQLLSKLGRKRYCWPSEATIAEEIGLSERQVRTHISKLKKIGCFWIIRGELVKTETGEYHRDVNTYDFMPLLFEYQKEVKVK